MNRFQWTDCRSLDQALEQSASADAVLKAGGVDLLDLLKEHIAAPRLVVNIRNLQGLDEIGEAQGGLRIGPLTTLAEIESSPLVRQRYPALADAAAHAATPQIRNMATVAGNLAQRPRCWYFRNEAFHCRKKGGTRCFAQDGENEYHAIFDNRTCAIVHPSGTAVPLVAYGASLEITSKQGKRNLPLEKFFTTPEQDVTRENVLEPGEIITAVLLPATSANLRSAYHKQMEKESFDWPLADVAVALDLTGSMVNNASIILGAAAPTPYRAQAGEAILKGKNITGELARTAAVESLNGASPLAHNMYKVPIFMAIIRRTILKAAGIREEVNA